MNREKAAEKTGRMVNDLSDLLTPGLRAFKKKYKLTWKQMIAFMEFYVFLMKDAEEGKFE